MVAMASPNLRHGARRRKRFLRQPAVKTAANLVDEPDAIG
jgi:hypothetical protein